MERANTAGGWVLRLRGTLNESFDGNKAVEGVNGVVIFDLDELVTVTSFGVRQWLAGLRRLRADYYAFIHCRPAVVAQFNMVTNFGGLGELVSLYMPYTCPDCDQVDEHLLDLRHDYATVSAGEVRDLPCSACGAQSEFDDLPDYFFSYVSSRPRPQVPAFAQRLIDGGRENKTEDRFHLVKEVDGLVTALWLSGPLEGKPKLKRLLAGLEGHVVAEMSGLTRVTGEALAHVARTARKAGVKTLSLARAPFDLLTPAAAHPEILRFMPIVSVLLDGQCEKCGAYDRVEYWLEPQPDGEDRLAGSGRCLECRGGVKATVPEALAQKLRSVLSIATTEIDIYLRRRPHTTAGSDTGSAVEFELARMAAQKYEIVSHIASGGMGEIHLARQRGPEQFQKTVVLKQIIPSLAANPDFVEMFLQEARIAAQVSHANVVQIFDLGRNEAGYFMAMEYVDGWDLLTVLRAAAAQKQRMPVNIACRIMSDVCAGLEAAHSATGEDGANLGIVHCDVSPHNILISKKGVAKLTDFGIAKAATSLDESGNTNFKGKLAYVAPEMITGGLGAVGPAADVFSAGLVLYQCVVGHLPFSGNTTVDSLRATLHDTLVPPSQVRRDITPALNTAICRALEKSIEDRHPSCAVLRMELENILVSEGRATTQTQVANWVATVIQKSNRPPAPPPAVQALRSYSQEGPTLRPPASAEEGYEIDVDFDDL